MPITVNGDSGISGVNGSAGTPALQGTDSNTGIVFGTDTVQVSTGGSTRATVDSAGNAGIGSSSPTSISGYSGLTLNNATNGGFVDLQNNGTTALRLLTNGSVNNIETRTATPLVFLTNGNEAARIDSSGRVGIGTDNPGQHLTIKRTGGQTQVSLISDTDQSGAIYFGDTASTTRGVVLYDHGQDSLQVYTAGSERMRISSGGSLFINRTTAVSSEKFSVGNDGQVAYFRCTVNANHSNIQMSHSYATGGQEATQISFQNASLTEVGSIKSTASTTSFNTSSDYRLKENVIDIADGITRVKQLLPKRFNFIVNADKTVDGFLAHEAQAVVPEAVTGEKDGEEMQGIDQSKLVPLLTAALQEAITKIETLETQNASLEARLTALEGGAS